MPFIRDELDKYFITHNPEQSHSDASDWWKSCTVSVELKVEVTNFSSHFVLCPYSIIKIKGWNDLEGESQR